MYEYIKGQLIELTPTDAIIEAYGVGYKILISLQTYSALRECNTDVVKLYVSHMVKEDDEQFYGFFDKDERSVFVQLISVSGVGPNTARMMLSSMNSDEIRNAILSSDVRRIQSIKGIGAKTAQRLILELKDKIVKGDFSASGSLLSIGSSSSQERDQASSALVLLGFSKPSVEKALNSILKDGANYSLEELIKKALKML